MRISNEDCYRVVGSSVHRNSNGSGGDAISDDNKLARAMFLGRRHIKMSRHESARCNAHATVVVRSAIKHVSSCIIGDAHKRIVRCRLLIVTVSSPLRHAVETRSEEHTSELQSLTNLVCRLLLEKKKEIAN